MSRYKTLILVMSLCILPVSYTQAQDPNDSDVLEEVAVKIVLIKFDVNDTKLELGWKITNNTDHDIWICGNFFDSDPCDLDTLPEFYMAEDKKTLMIRKRLDVPSYTIWSMVPYCMYTHLRPGEHWTESLSLHVPIRSKYVFEGDFSDGGHASRLVLEIGYYDENLPELILDIIEIAEKFDGVGRGAGWRDKEIACRYFPGLIVNDFLGDSSGGFHFISRSEAYGFDPNEQIIVPYTYQALSGEKVLQLEINGVHIPMTAGRYQTTNRESKKTIDEKMQQANSPGKNKTKPDKG